MALKALLFELIEQKVKYLVNIYIINLIYIFISIYGKKQSQRIITLTPGLMGH